MGGFESGCWAAVELVGRPANHTEMVQRMRLGLQLCLGIGGRAASVRLRWLYNNSTEAEMQQFWYAIPPKLGASGGLINI
jgi:hypothetical protein